MLIIGYFLLFVYCICVFLVTLYCVLQLDLLSYYRQREPQVTPPMTDADAPCVTIQLPIYNERYVAERMIDNIVLMDYPREKLDIQIIDDSDDETVAVVAAKVEEYRKKGFDMQHVRRPNRQGFKAGALKDATPLAKGDFLAIFDADFVPLPDFLRKTVPYFLKDEKIAVVQTRWEHINENYSIITKLQALQLNVHFTVEQAGRQNGGLLLQFNGTAGVWRKAAIDDAGGWHSDTLTEDLDLSYRAQLKGWKIEFLEEVGSPAELPADMNGLKGQQFRWMKGGAENARKLLPIVFDSNLPTKVKVHAAQHLFASGTFMLIFFAAIVSVPLIPFIPELFFDTKFFFFSILGLGSVFALMYMGNLGQYVRKDKPKWKEVLRLIGLFPVFMPMSMGLSLHNTIAVIEGYTGKKSDFVRTPKFGLDDKQGTFRQRLYLARRPSLSTIFEGLLAVYFAFGIYLAERYDVHEFQIFHLLLMLGFGAISFLSIKHLR